MHKSAPLLTSTGNPVKLAGARLNGRQMGKAFTFIHGKEALPKFVSLEQACSWMKMFGIKHKDASQLEIDDKLDLTEHDRIVAQGSADKHKYSFNINYGGILESPDMVAAGVMILLAGARFRSDTRTNDSLQFIQVTNCLWSAVEGVLGQGQSVITLAEYTPTHLVTTGPPERLTCLPLTRSAALSNTVMAMSFGTMSRERQDRALNQSYPPNKWRWPATQLIADTFPDPTLALGGLKTLVANVCKNAAKSETSHQLDELEVWAHKREAAIVYEISQGKVGNSLIVHLSESSVSSKGLLPPDDDDSADGVGDSKGKGVSTNRLYISSREITSAMMHPSYVAASAVITPLLQLADITPKKLMKIMERGPCRCLIMAQAIFWNKNLRKCGEVLNLLCSKSPMLNVYFSYGHVADPNTGKRRGYSEDFALHTGLQANWLGGRHELCNLSREGAMLVNQAVEGATSLAVGSELDSLVNPESFQQ